MLVFEYPACSTCKKALKWLNDNGIAYENIHIVENPPTLDQLRTALRASGLPIKRFFNTSGQSYRDGGFGEKLKTISEEQALQALAADGKLIKRPLVIGIPGDKILVGFKEEEWATTLK